MDQYLYPFYKKDIIEGRISDEEIVEIFQCLRLKDMEINRISGQANRQKNAGMAKWHNCVIGGQTEEMERMPVTNFPTSSSKRPFVVLRHIIRLL